MTTQPKDNEAATTAIRRMAIPLEAVIAFGGAQGQHPTSHMPWNPKTFTASAIAWGFQPWRKRTLPDGAIVVYLPTSRPGDYLKSKRRNPKAAVCWYHSKHVLLKEDQGGVMDADKSVRWLKTRERMDQTIMAHAESQGIETSDVNLSPALVRNIVADVKDEEMKRISSEEEEERTARAETEPHTVHPRTDDEEVTVELDTETDEERELREQREAISAEMERQHLEQDEVKAEMDDTPEPMEVDPEVEPHDTHTRLEMEDGSVLWVLNEMVGMVGDAIDREVEEHEPYLADFVVINTMHEIQHHYGPYARGVSVETSHKMNAMHVYITETNDELNVFGPFNYGLEAVPYEDEITDLGDGRVKRTCDGAIGTPGPDKRITWTEPEPAAEGITYAEAKLIVAEQDIEAGETVTDDMVSVPACPDCGNILDSEACMGACGPIPIGVCTESAAKGDVGRVLFVGAPSIAGESYGGPGEFIEDEDEDVNPDDSGAAHVTTIRVRQGTSLTIDAPEGVEVKVVVTLA